MVMGLRTNRKLRRSTEMQKKQLLREWIALDYNPKLIKAVSYTHLTLPTNREV